MDQPLSEATVERLERLAKLRESGVLTDAEFEQQKRLLLTTPAPAFPTTAPARSGLAKSPFFWVILISGLIIVGIGLVWLLRPGVGPAPSEENQTQPQNPQALTSGPVQPSIRSLPQDEQLSAAFRAAFGRTGRARLRVGDQTYIYRPAMLEWIGSRAALISVGANVEQFHVSAGSVAIHYLEPSADGFRVTGSWPAIISVGSFGAAPDGVQINRALSQYPVVYAEGGGTWQGYTCSWAQLVELQPQRPVPSDPIPMSYSNGGAVQSDTGQTMGGELAASFEGRFRNIVRGRSFDVAYTGDTNAVDHFIYRGGRYVIASGRRREVC